MIKGKELLGRKVIALSSGEEIKTVRDIVLDHQGNQVLALLVDTGNWFRPPLVVPFHQVSSLGHEAVMIDNHESVTAAGKHANIKEALATKISLLGMSLLTTQGDLLGRISDVCFDEKTGQVEGYVATGGLFADISNGRTFIPVPKEIQIGYSTAIVPMAVAQAMEEQPAGGIKGAVSRTGASINSAVQTTGANITSAVQTTGSKVTEAYSSATDNVKDAVGNMSTATKTRQKEYVIGRTAGTEIIAEDGTIIVKKGEVITGLHAEVADWHGKLGPLITSVTGGALANVTSQAQQRIQTRYENVTNMTKDRQLEYVVGKKAGSDLILEDKTVIVKKGDTITLDQATEAEQHGKLLTLTSAATGGVWSGVVNQTREGIQVRYEGMSEATKERQREYVVGKKAGSDLLLEDGTILIKSGDPIEAYHVDEAEKHNLLGSLATSATGGSIAQVAQMASDSLRKQYSHISTATKDRQIEYVVGKQVASDIALEDGSVLLKKGEEITVDHAVAAEQKGKLFALTTSATSASIASVASQAREGMQTQYENLATASKDRQRTYAIGKRAGQDITLEHGIILVKKGDTITEGHTELAEKHNKLLALATAATGGSIATVVEGAQKGAEERYESIAEATKERQMEYALGRQAGTDLVLKDGQTLIQKGETISEEHVAIAKKEGKLLALVTGITSGAIGDTVSMARERVTESYEDVRNASTERQKEYVIGKVAGSDLRSDAGELIVMEGHKITPFQAERAEQAGKLGALTTAVMSGVIHTPVHAPALFPEPVLENTIGRRVKADIRSSSGSLVAVQGQIVNTAIADRAKHLGLTDQLIESTIGKKTPTQSASEGASAVSDAVAEAAANVTASAGNFIERARSWLNEKRIEADQAAERHTQSQQDQYIRQSLGRPVGRVILAPDDSVILNVGEIVTHKAVQEAKSGDVLDILLESVQTTAMNIDPLANRPAETGRAALASQSSMVRH